MVGDILRRISVIDGDITELQVDVIVNAANMTLLGGGGVDGAIHRAAGPELLEECRALGGSITGETKITKGYRLPARFVIHTVGPVWRGGDNNEDWLLASCYRRSLELAEANGLVSVAFPAISTGAYGFPLARATLIAVRAVLEHLSRSPALQMVVFVCHGDRAFRLYSDAIGELAGGERSGESAGASRPAGAGPEGRGGAGEIREQVTGQLQVIEAVHGVRFVNRDRLAAAIASMAGDRKRASFVTAALNSWVAISGTTEEVEVPNDLLDRILRQAVR